MKVLFDFGHPADVHYFKHVIRHLGDRGHDSLILARNKEVSAALLEDLGFRYINKGDGGTGIIDRAEYLVHSVALIRDAIKTYTPDLCISHASPYLALAAKLHNVPHIMFNDTERAAFFKQIVHWSRPEVYVPDCYLNKDIEGLRFLPSYMELAYLHPDLFEPDKSVKEVLGEKYMVLRFVSHSALHDYGSRQPNLTYKHRIIEKLKPFGNIWISSEHELPGSLEPFRFPLPPAKMHDAIACSALVMGDSATMCTEAAVLGIPSVHIHQNRWGYIRDLEENYGLIRHFQEDDDSRNRALEAATECLTDGNYNRTIQEGRSRMLSEKKNMTSLMAEIIDAACDKIRDRNV